MGDAALVADIRQLFHKLQNLSLVQTMRHEDKFGTEIRAFIPDSAWLTRPDAPYIEPDDLIVLGVA